MASGDLRLIKSYHYDSDERRWGANDDWLWKYEEASGLHTFACKNGEAYIVSSRYSGSGENDGVDSEHRNHLYIWVHPIPLADAESEKEVKALKENGKDGYTGTYDGTLPRLRGRSFISVSIRTRNEKEKAMSKMTTAEALRTCLYENGIEMLLDYPKLRGTLCTAERMSLGQDRWQRMWTKVTWNGK